MLKSYAGIGSRKAPDDVLRFFIKASGALAELGYVVNSGGAAKSDEAFEKGTINFPTQRRIYLPREPFRGKFADSNFGYYYENPHLEFSKELKEKLELLCVQHHPGWIYLEEYTKEFMRRNCYQILTFDLNTPVDFVLTWTPCGAETADERTSKTGGTGFAISLASSLGIPVYNIKKEGRAEMVFNMIKEMQNERKKKSQRD